MQGKIQTGKKLKRGQGCLWPYQSEIGPLMEKLKRLAGQVNRCVAYAHPVRYGCKLEPEPVSAEVTDDIDHDKPQRTEPR